MAKNKDELVKIEYVVPKDLQDGLIKKITEAITSTYYGDVGRAISERVHKELSDDGFIEEVSKTVVENIKVSKEDFIDGLSKNVTDSLLNVTNVIATETLDKIAEKVKSYGFIKIADRY